MPSAPFFVFFCSSLCDDIPGRSYSYMCIALIAYYMTVQANWYEKVQQDNKILSIILNNNRKKNWVCAMETLYKSDYDIHVRLWHVTCMHATAIKYMKQTKKKNSQPNKCAMCVYRAINRLFGLLIFHIIRECYGARWNGIVSAYCICTDTGTRIYCSDAADECIFNSFNGFEFIRMKMVCDIENYKYNYDSSLTCIFLIRMDVLS